MTNNKLDAKLENKLLKLLIKSTWLNKYYCKNRYGPDQIRPWLNGWWVRPNGFYAINKKRMYLQCKYIIT